MINMNRKKESVVTLNPSDRINNFDEVELTLDDATAEKEALRCLNCKLSPCTKGCPVGIDIPGFIRCIANRDIKSASDIIYKSNFFPAICGRVCPQEKQCEFHCVRSKTGEPVAIGRLERYVADKNIKSKKVFNNINISNTMLHKIAVVGSGPSGLSCASELIDKGYQVTIFEALHAVGGVLAYGIPEFRLPRNVLDYEIKNLKNKGVKLVLNTVIGKSMSIDDLFKEGFSAVYIACGAGLPRFMNIPGEGLSGVYSANEFLTRINLMKAYKESYDTPITRPKNVLVIGGGNVAMDAARCAKRIGPEKVTIMYRRSEAEMPARKEEIHHAREEGIEFLFLSNPVEFFGDSGRVSGARYSKMKFDDVDNTGRRNVIPISDEKFEILADMVIVAIGNDPNPLMRNDNSGINFDSRGRVIVDSETTRTSRKFVYAGGDIVTGAATVILAMGAGKKAAYQIACDLSNG